MPRKFCLTYSRTAYFDVDLAADNAADAERLLEAAMAGDAGACNGVRPIGKPVHRVVEIAALEEEASAGPHEEAA